MATTVLILVIAAVALGICWSLLRRRDIQLQETVANGTKPELDVRVLRNVLDHRQELYLRDRLARTDFRILQRRRIVLALRMLRMAEDNCARLVGLSHLAKAKADPRAIQASEELAAAALDFRLNAIAARCCLYLKWVFPGWMILRPTFAAKNLLDSLVFVQRACQALN